MSDDLDFDIWPPYEFFYIESMLISTRAAVNAGLTANHVIDRLATDERDPQDIEPTRELILDSVQTIISSGAALSRYLWPVRKGELHQRRGRKIRQALAITDENPLRNRELRNMIEHFDERLDAFLQGIIAGHIIPTYVGNLPPDPEVPTFFFRAYYVDAAILEVLGERFQVNPIMEEISRIHILLEGFSQNGSRFRGPDAAEA